MKGGLRLVKVQGIRANERRPGPKTKRSLYGSDCMPMPKRAPFAHARCNKLQGFV